MKNDIGSETEEVNSLGPDVLSAGLDEVGMGAWAGPALVVVAVFNNKNPKVEGLKDSKKMSPIQRRLAIPRIFERAVFTGFGWVTAQTIDEKGLAEAWQEAAGEAVRHMPPGCRLMVDGERLVRKLPEGWFGRQCARPHADADFWQVSAASILAKEARDQVMTDMAVYYPHWYWELNAGYGTAEHQNALIRFGMTPLHRRTFLRKAQKKLGITFRV